MTMFSSATYQQAKNLGRTVMPRIVDPQTHMVRFARVIDLDRMLRLLGFALIQRDVYGPAGGRQLFYRNGLVLVRLKTKGDAKGFRKNQPHLSAGIHDGRGLAWENDRAKFTASGKVTAKSITTPDRFNEEGDFQGKPHRFVVLLGGAYTDEEKDTIQQTWADRTHFPCPPGFSDAGVDGLVLTPA